MKRGAALPLLVATCLLLHSSGAPAESPPRGSGVELAEFEGWTRLSVATEGRLVSYALPRAKQLGREIVLLVAPDDSVPDLTASPDNDDEAPDEPEKLPPCPSDEAKAKTALYRVGREAEPGLTLIEDGLPHDCEALDSADLDESGEDDLLLACKGSLLVVDANGSRTLTDDPALAWSSLHPRATERPELDGRLLATSAPLGRLILFGPGDDARHWKRLAEAELPVVGIVRPGALTLRNPIPRFIGARKDGALLFATGPERFGTQRLGVSLITIGPRDQAESTDCWARLPEPEQLLEEHFLLIDDRPMLLVTTKPADKLNIFGEKRVRLYTLERDRSRLGRPPVYVTESRINMWQQASPFLLDVNGDGREDLVLGYWKGLKDDKVVLDAYLREAEGWFATTPRTTAFNVVPAKRRLEGESKPERPDADRSFVEYGRDLDGDSFPDLLLRTASTLMIFRGLTSTTGEKLVDKTAFELPLETVGDPGEYVVEWSSEGGLQSYGTGVAGRPRLVDVDGDGTAEILIVHRGHGSAPDVLEVLRLEREKS